MGTTKLAGYPFPEASELPDGPLQFGNLGRAVEMDVITAFASPAARDAAIKTPVEGMFARVTGSLQYWTKAGGWKVYWPLAVIKPTWYYPTIGTGWTVAGGWYSPAYCKDNLGFVHLRGLVRNSSGAAASGTAKPIITLPAGYRPANQQSDVSWSATGDVPARMDVDTSGRVYSSSSIASNQYAGIDMFCFQGV